MREIALIIHDVRSSLNVGAMLRTAEGIGVSEVILTGYTPYPMTKNDERLPYLASKIDKRIAKTSLSAEKSLAWRHEPSLKLALTELKSKGFTLAALEQTENASDLTKFQAPARVALIVGNEVLGLAPEIIKLCDLALEIPMAGSKESYNVASAAAITLYHLKYML